MLQSDQHKLLVMPPPPPLPPPKIDEQDAFTANEEVHLPSEMPSGVREELA